MTEKDLLIQELRKRVARLEAELRANGDRIERLLDALALAADSTARAAVMGRIEKLTQRNRELTQAISLAAERAHAPAGEGWEFAAILAGMDTPQKREALGQLIRRARWDGSRVELELAGDPEGNGCEDSK